MTAQTLTIDAMKLAARNAVEEGYIGFLQGMQTCRYYDRNKGGKCAIGAILNPEVLDALKGTLLNDAAVNRLYLDDYVDGSEVERKFAIDLQRAHDNVCDDMNVLKDHHRFGRDGLKYVRASMYRFLVKVGYDEAIIPAKVEQLIPIAVASYADGECTN